MSGEADILISRIAELCALKGGWVVNLSSKILEFRPRLEAYVVGTQAQEVGEKGWLVRASVTSPPGMTSLITTLTLSSAVS